MDVSASSWATRFYPRALEDEVPEVWRGAVRRFISERVGWMDDKDISVVETWDAASRSAVG
jgi:hypothetical protein